jgi:hypothetical protein
MDPAALGTLILGLDDVRREALEDPKPISRPARRAHRPRRAQVAGALASALRGFADVLEPGLDPSAGRLGD